MAAIVAFSLAVFVIVHRDPVPQAGEAIGYTSPPAITSPRVITSHPSAVQTTPPRVQPKPVVAFLGDDYILGTGASRRSSRFTTLVCRALSLTERNFGVDGSGYASTASGTGDYLARIAAVVAARPDIVVVGGGRNDVNDDIGTVAANASLLFAALHTMLPRAVLVALAPMWGDSEPTTALTDIAAAVKTAATAAGGTYLDITDPLRGHPNWMADDADPNDSGHAAIALAVELALKPLLPAPEKHSASALPSATGG